MAFVDDDDRCLARGLDDRLNWVGGVLGGRAMGGAIIVAAGGDQVFAAEQAERLQVGVAGQWMGGIDAGERFELNIGE
nr:hypothetical protein [Sphingomonas melonis]